MIKSISTVIALLSFICAMLFATPSYGATASLISDIKKAQQRLNATQANISKQSAALNKKTQQTSQQVADLRRATSNARRLFDEQTLSLNSLKKRLDSWQQQDTYQRNLLARFYQQQSLTPHDDNITAPKNLAQLSNTFASFRSQLTPTWQTQKVVAQDGVINPLSTLKIGPVTWYLDESKQQAGFAIDQQPFMQQGLTLADDDYSALHTLKAGEIAEISFDPTLTRALKIAQAQESVADHVEKGGVWVIPIIAFGVFALLISIAKAVQLMRLPAIMPALAERLNNIASDDQTGLDKFTQQTKGMQRELIEIALNTEQGQSRDDKLFAALLRQKHKLEYWLGAVAITAAVSPLLGLLGTVSGMIETFKLMTLFGAGDASAVSGGISEALVTTELGLVVAIPALLMHALLSRKVKTYYGLLEDCGIGLSQAQASQPLKQAA
ncbi:MotA/TolQ/ExbB proton channel family protein [Psychrobium sp. MM17-31]|uniref:MotA/TolQ/ExbB proton channel family protein n=1 Tax=Psychrobium sp. MM17-31 TaxID=2917758 RepID=UPI001EF45A5F|nr:MotA/TolQ/ExbB proton channel family protein [Psychrobium sp. MM17-31]MCG7533166.1 MotA/TolQ/ExbB proton channel family protein [Psychrobium sp. MM17-31]